VTAGIVGRMNLPPLKQAERDAAPWLARSTALLLADSTAAIGFAAGLAGAVAALAEQPRSAAPWLLLALVCACLRGGAAMLAVRCGAVASRQARSALRGRVVAGALGGTRFGAAAATGGTLMQRVVDEVDAVDAYVARFVPARRAATFAPLLVLAAVACASPVTAAILLVSLLPFVVLMALAGAASARESERQFSALSRLSGLFADRLRALPVVLAFGAAARESARLNDASQDVAGRTLRVLRLAFMSSAVLEFFAALCVAMVAVYAGFNLLGLLPFPVPEKLDLAHAFFVLALAPEFLAPMRRLAAAYHDRQAAMTATERLAPLAREAVPAPRPAAQAGQAAPSLRFENVTIRYPGQPQATVQGLSFTVAPGSTVAIVGPTGSGKTSLLRLLLGVAPLASGRVLVNERCLDEGESIAAQAAWVGQHPLMVPGTLHDNLLLAWPEASRAAVSDAASQAGLGGSAAGQRLRLDRPIDARGGGLSGGEKRRVALARAVLKPASVWLLDEPTAHLDEAAEIALIDTIRRASRGRTTLIATHSERLAAMADVVVRLEATA
jgi:ATP-binding cassette subfamily C protein CydD